MSAQQPFSWSGEVRDIAADIGDLVARFRLAGQAGLAGRSGRVDDRGVSVATVSNDFAGQASGRLGTSLAALENAVRVNPLHAVGLAILAGAIIGAVGLRR